MSACSSVLPPRDTDDLRPQPLPRVAKRRVGGGVARVQLGGELELDRPLLRSVRRRPAAGHGRSDSGRPEP